MTFIVELQCIPDCTTNYTVVWLWFFTGKVVTVNNVTYTDGIEWPKNAK